MSKWVDDSRLNRRRVLQMAGAGLLAATGLGALPRTAFATPDSAAKWLGGAIGGKAIAESGKIKIDMPQIAENGNTVPLTVIVDSPMTDKDHVKAIHVAADGNPQPEVVTFNLSPMAGKAEVSTRMRLAKTQNVWAVAEMSDGSVHAVKTEVKVTIGGCGG